MRRELPVQPTLDRRRAFGDRIRELRELAKLSQEALAESSGLHRTYISSIERGQRNVTLTNIYALAHGLGVEIRELFPEP